MTAAPPEDGAWVQLPPLTVKDAAERPREFALAVQLLTDAGGSVAAGGRVRLEELRDHARRYGSATALSGVGAGAALDFTTLSAALGGSERTVNNDINAAAGNCLAFAARDMTGHLAPYRFDRGPLGERDVRIQVLWCGICHTDLHNVRGEWGDATFPLVPGHEVVGVVTAMGGGASRHAVGDRVGVGFMVGSCLDCEACGSGEEQFCARRVYTSNSRVAAAPAAPPGADSSSGIGGSGSGSGGDAAKRAAIVTPRTTMGGFSSHMVVDERFVVRVPDALPLAQAAPLLCAGITTFSPLKRFGLGRPGRHVGVVGLGGLGHLAVRLAKAMGCRVTVISGSESKREEALETLGADAFVCSARPAEMAALAGALHGLLDTVAGPHELPPLLRTLRWDGTLVLLGAPEGAMELRPFDVLPRRLSIAGSIIGGIAETQECLDFCAQHDVRCMTEAVPLTQAAVNTAMERLARGDVRYRFVADVAAMTAPTAP